MVASTLSGAEARAWLTLIRAPGLGGVRIRTLLDRFGSAATALDAGASAWRSAAVPASSIDWLRSGDKSQVESDLAWLDDERHQLVVCTSEDFPPLLGRTPSAPAALFVVGSPDVLWRAQIAVVGSRNPTAGGADNARSFARALAASGLTITSGLADGIDAAAHRATIDANGLTIAVMGTGPERVYPTRNRALARDIVESGGALVTEFPPGSDVRKENFPRRNRLIAGLSLGVLVVEAALQSGALITARLAAEAGREVFALPGSIHNPLARGCHRLIRDGAALVESVQEIYDAIASAARDLGGELESRLAAIPEPSGFAGEEAASDGPECEAVLAALGHDPVDLDQLVGRTGLTVEVLSPMLLLLELEGRVSAHHGRYALQT